MPTLADMTEQYRYADGPETEVSRVIAASPDAIWTYVSDINFSKQFSSEFLVAEWLDGATEPAVGAKFRGTNENDFVGRWQVECTITECEPGSVFGWMVQGGDGPAATWRFTLDEVDGGTQVTQWVRLGPGRSGLTPAIERMPDREHDIIAHRLSGLSENMLKNLDGLAELVA